MIEEWQPVNINGETWPYEVSNLGRVRRSEPGSNSTWIGRLLKPEIILNTGRPQFSLHRDGKKYRFRAHQLVFSAFNGPLLDGYVIHHKDHNKLNNCPSNLVGLPAEIHRRGEYHPSAKLVEEDVIEIRKVMDRLKEKYGVSGATLGHVADRRNWGYLE